MIPGTKVAIRPALIRTGVVLGTHKCGVLVHLDDGPSRYYDVSWLVAVTATTEKEASA